jgi:uncharacterized membrane protein YhhN
MSGAYTKTAAFLTAVAVILAIAGQLADVPWLVYIFKPLATILIILVAFANWRARHDRYALWITVGLIFSLSGDIWLIWGARYFLFGLAAFLCAHIAYLIAFTRDVKFPARPIVWLLYLAIGAALCTILWPKLFAALKLPVALYTFFLASMAAQAMGRFLTLRTPFARLAAIGAAFFLLSDTLLAINEFYTPLPFSVLSVLGSYYLAQWLIASSTFQEWGKPIQTTSPWFSSQ